MTPEHMSLPCNLSPSPHSTHRQATVHAQAAEDVKVRKKRAAEYAAVQVEEAAKAKVAQEDAKREYEAQESAKAEELAARVARDRAYAAERAKQKQAEAAERCVLTLPLARFGVFFGVRCKHDNVAQGKRRAVKMSTL